ncbi:MAG: sensor histidine kinase [Rhodospirillales bacterium]
MSGISAVLVTAAVVFIVLILYQKLNHESRIAEELNNGLNDLQYLTTDFLTTSTPRALKQWQSRHQRLGKFLDNVPVRDVEVQRLLPELRTRHGTLGSVFNKLIRIDTSIRDPSRAATAKRAAVSRLQNQILALAALKDRISSIYRERETTFIIRASAATGAVLLGGILLVAFLYLRVLRMITANVERLSAEIVRVGKGDFAAPVQQYGDGDIGEVFQAVEHARVRLADATTQMEQERADLDHFVYVASHDFKAPLRGIDNLATWIEEDSGDSLNAEAREHLAMMRRRIKRLEALLDDLLAYSQAGRAKVEFENVDVGTLLRSIVDDLELPPGFDVAIDPDMPVIYSPKTPLAHVFINLINNAIKHHDRSAGRIEVSGEVMADGYAFTVCDDGPGIPEKHRERIFEMFRTLKPRDVVEGSGMGLTIAKRLVQSNNGAIAVAAGENDRGACIRFTWRPGGETNAELAG